MTLPVPLMNRDRAEQVMQAAGVSALVLTEPVNVYHATGYWPQTVAMGQTGSILAIVPADRTQAVTLIASQFHHYYLDIDDVDPAGPLHILLYTAVDEHGGAAAPKFFRSPAGAPPDPFEWATRKTTLSLLDATPAYPTQRDALGDLLASSRSTRLIATDSPLPQKWFGDDYAWTVADPMLRRIRMIKSPQEIALMRHAARNNAEAARQSVENISPDATYEDLRRAFFAETGRRGGIPLFMSIDNASYRQRDGRIRDGRAFMIDAVSHYAGYHGDYGRTVCIGDPAPALKDALAAAQLANNAVARMLRPGIHYSDVMAAGHSAIQKAGFDIDTPSIPHSVGLFHTDEAFKDDALHFAKADHLIEKDMVLSVDCPIMQADMGGTVHLEDLWLITEDGCEPLNDTSDQFIRI